MADWLASNLQARADRDTINEIARKAAEAADAVEPASMSVFLCVEDLKADQQKRSAALGAAASYR